MNKILKNISFGFLITVMFTVLCGLLLYLLALSLSGMSGIVDQISPLQSQGYEAVLSFDDGLVLYFNGEEMTDEQWQGSMETKIDGKVGYKTLKKAMELNDTDVRRF